MKTYPTLTDLSFISLYDAPGDSSVGLFRGRGMTEARHVVDADVIVFNGGTDIGSLIYDENAVYTNSHKPSNRDRVETDIFKLFPTKFKVGICRGSQLLNCLNGGRLWQDVNNHGWTHKATDTRTGEVVEVTSTHHQMMRPNLKTGEVIMVADEATEKRSEHDTWSSKGGVFYPDDHKDTEIVWYPGTRSLCVQGHPEYVPNSHFAKYFFKLLMNCYHASMEIPSSVV